jgi:hypothetical protein
VESDQLPRRSRRLLQLPPVFESLPSKRRRVISSGTHTSTFQTCDPARMSTESSLQNTGSSSTPNPTIINGTPSTPAAATVAVPEAYTGTMARPVVNASSLASNPFGGFGHSPSYNVQTIPMASSPFSYGMPNFTSQFSTAIPAAGHNASLGLGGTTPPYTPSPFGGSHIPQVNPNVGSVPILNPGSNPSTAGWNNPAGGQVPPYIPIPSVSIPTNTFGMTNPLQSSGFPPGGGQSYTLGTPQPGSNPVGGSFNNPQLGSNPTGGNFHNPYQNIPAGMMPNPYFTNQPGGGSYNSDKVLVLTRILDGTQFLMHNLSWEDGVRCRNPVFPFWPCLICQICLN